MGFIEAVKTCLIKYVNFSGRAPRSEFWYFILFYVLSVIVLNCIESILMGHNPFIRHESPEYVSISLPKNGILHDLFSFVMLLPSIAVNTRRLHDLNRSGWWQLIAITVIGIVPLIYWYCKKGTDGNNRFGEDTLQE